jgi:hypothetical protein
MKWFRRLKRPDLSGHLWEKVENRMRTILCKVFAVVSLLVLLIVPPQVIGWGQTGHEAVAYIAWQQMTPATRTRVMELLKQVPTLHNAANTKSIPGYAE